MLKVSSHQNKATDTCLMFSIDFVDIDQSNPYLGEISLRHRFTLPPLQKALSLRYKVQ